MTEAESVHGHSGNTGSHSTKTASVQLLSGASAKGLSGTGESTLIFEEQKEFIVFFYRSPSF